jgi:predicted lipoprotein with Yx(FWY)xxD motif
MPYKQYQQVPVFAIHRSKFNNCIQNHSVCLEENMKSFTSLATIFLVSTIAHADLRDNAPVTLVQVNGQQLLADRNQMTAYVFDSDAPGVSNCYKACAKAWPPILLAAGEQVQAPFALTTRTDGSQQLTFNNSPIYLYVGDEAPGDITGDGLGNVWHIIPVISEP